MCARPGHSHGHGCTRAPTGGHGALTIALKNPGRFKSVSAFAPICNPTSVPWGQKAFAGYLGGWGGPAAPGAGRAGCRRSAEGALRTHAHASQATRGQQRRGGAAGPGLPGCWARAPAPLPPPSSPTAPLPPAARAGEEDKAAWQQHDACELMRRYQGPHMPLLVDTGSADSFLQVRAA
jgi:hypothetical protein